MLGIVLVVHLNGHIHFEMLSLPICVLQIKSSLLFFCKDFHRNQIHDASKCNVFRYIPCAHMNSRVAMPHPTSHVPFHMLSILIDSQLVGCVPSEMLSLPIRLLQIKYVILCFFKAFHCNQTHDASECNVFQYFAFT